MSSGVLLCSKHYTRNQSVYGGLGGTLTLLALKVTGLNCVEAANSAIENSYGSQTDLSVTRSRISLTRTRDGQKDSSQIPYREYEDSYI